jgi:RHS repeat-associated protein
MPIWEIRDQVSSVVQSGTAFSAYGSTNGSSFRLQSYDAHGQLTVDLGYLGSDTTNTATPLTDRSYAYTYDAAGNRKSSNYTGTDGLKETYTVNDLNQFTARDNLSVPVSGFIGTSSTEGVVIGTGTSSGTSTSLVLAGHQGGYWAGEALPPLSSGSPANATTPASVFLMLTAGDSSSGGHTYSTSPTTLILPPMSQTLTYDVDGNLTSDSMWSYTYDGENRLIQMDTSSAAQTYAGLAHNRLKFKYDYLGRRVEKWIGTVSGSSETVVSDDRYVYDGWNLIADYQVSGSTLTLYRTFTWGLDVTGSLTAAGGVGALLEISNVSGSSTTDYFPTYDGNGNVASLVSPASGYQTSPAAVYEYSPFGESIQARAVDSAVTDNPFRFSSKFTDAETKLIYYGNRYYSPNLGRFINRDPAEEGGGNNLYAFCSNDAIDLFDVLGNDPGGQDSYGMPDSETAGISAPPSGGTYNNPESDPTNPNGIAYWQFQQALEGGTQAAAEAIIFALENGGVQGYAGGAFSNIPQSKFVQGDSNLKLFSGDGGGASIGDVISGILNVAGTIASGALNGVSDMVSAAAGLVAGAATDIASAISSVTQGSSNPLSGIPEGSVTYGPLTVKSWWYDSPTDNAVQAPNSAASGGVLLALGYKQVVLFGIPTGEYHTFVVATDLTTGQQIITRGGPSSSLTIYAQGGAWTENWFFRFLSGWLIPEGQGAC